jgi:hypothetical protein
MISREAEANTLKEKNMSKTSVLAAVALLLCCSTTQAAGLKFLNRTGVTIVNLQFAPLGSGAWGPNQCKNDDEGEVDHNERLTLTGIQAGRYDVKLGDKKGRVCTIKNVDVQEGNPVIVREQDLASCTR